MSNIQNLIFKCIAGSHMYGTNTPQSDTDIKGVYIQSLDSILRNGYNNLIQITDDEVYYELRFFTHLLIKNNPNIMELFYCPDDCILYEDSLWKEIKEELKDKILSKICKGAYIGYATEQITKAFSLDKKMNWEKSRIENKTVLDFCYFIEKESKQSVPLNSWLLKNNYKQEFCGLSKVPNMKGIYNLYYDHIQDVANTNPRYQSNPLYRGICSDKSNEVRCSEIPEYLSPEGVMYFNKEGYETWCKDYASYLQWLKNRNEQRYVDIENHNQKIDGKNMLHCIRLIQTAKDIIEKKQLIVRRENAKFLIDVRKGKYSLEKILEKSKEELQELISKFENSDLPEKPNGDLINEIIHQKRLKFYEQRNSSKD